jgi:ectoine hydroxylase-related dioxygenase (phytanoyl-CoA dioxygenase family)
MTKKEEFRKKGYIVIKNVFDKDEIISLRNKCSEVFEKLNIKKNTAQQKSKPIRQIFNQEFIKNPNLLNPLFKRKIVAEVKEVLGDDYISFADFSLNDNMHAPTWHTDSQSMGFSTKYVYNPSFNVAKLGLYLQEDDAAYGGQLDVIPGSHLPTFLGVNSPISIKSRYGKVSKLQLLAIKIRNKFLKKTSLKVSLGDVILFHGLLWHRSSQPNWAKVGQIDKFGIKNQPRDKRKFMFQWEVSENNEFAKFYATHQSNRVYTRYKEASKISIDDFSNSSRSLFDSNNINIKSYSDLKIAIKDNLKSKDGTPIIFPNE